MLSYEKDVAGWSFEQASLIRQGKLDLLDLEHIADEIEDVGKSEQRELVNRMALLISHLLKWEFQPERRGSSWEKTIKAQRKEISYSLDESPSLRGKLDESKWVDMVWSKAVAKAVSETELDCFPEECLWSFESEILNHDWFPDSSHAAHKI